MCVCVCVCVCVRLAIIDEVDQLMKGARMEQRQLYVDRRLQVNRGRQVKMYRVWVQAKYRRPHTDDITDDVTDDITDTV